MSAFRQNIKGIGKVLTYVATGILFFMIMGAAIHHENAQTITGFEVNSGNKDGNNFVDDSDIYTILRNSQYTSTIGSPVQNAGLERLSAILDNNPYVKRADIYVGADGEVIVKIHQRTAILRVINNAGVSFYIDENGDKMPASDKFTPRVEVATGLIFNKGNPNDTSDGAMMGKLYFLAKKIEANAFMNALVQQIYVDENRELELIPSVGNFSILIGDTDRLNDKFANLQSVYKDHPDDFPWNAYTMLNLKYAHQVVGIKNAAGTVIVPTTINESAKKIMPKLSEKQIAEAKSDSVQVRKAGKKKAEKSEKKEKQKKRKKDSQ
jgi:cell division protein FtsQ